MSTSSPEATRSVSVGTAPSTWATASLQNASRGIRDGLAHGRERLAGTVEAVAHKAKVPDAVKDAWSDTKDTVQDKVGQVTRKLQDGKETVQGSASGLTQQAKGLTEQARAQVPEPVAGRVDQLTQVVRQRPAPAAAIILAVLALLLLRWIPRNRRAKSSDR
jgi:gas vesicle protein